MLSISLVSILLMMCSVMANDFELTVSPSNQVLYANESTSVDVMIKNTGVVADTYSLSLYPTQFGSVSSTLERYSVTVGAGDTEDVKLYFAAHGPDAQEGTDMFTITVKSQYNPNDVDSTVIFMRVVRKTNVYLDKEINIDNPLAGPSQSVRIQTSIINIGSKPSDRYSLQTIVEKNGIIVKTYDDSIISIPPAKSNVLVNDTYTIGKYDEPGDYDINVMLLDASGNIIGGKTSKFNVEVVNVTQNLLTEYTTRKSSFNFFFINVDITTKNEGNVPSPSFYITASMSGIEKILFDPSVEPTKSNQSDGRYVYSWLVDSLDPGKNVTISYSYDLWKIWVTIVVVGVAIYVILKLLYKPVIIKRYKHEGPIRKDKEISISLDVRNRTRHEAKDVEIRDVVPPIAKVVEKFDTLAPRMRTTDIGTEMRWKIDSLKPGEERVVTYRIKPALDIKGSINLPKAHARYLDRKKVKRIIASKAVMVRE